MDRTEARALWASSGLDYSVLTPDSLSDLVDSIDRAMMASGAAQGSLRMKRPPVIHGEDGVVTCAELRCRSAYFRDREAVTFNDNGFIGFAGWADETNVVPVLDGFAEWVAELTQRTAITSATTSA